MFKIRPSTHDLTLKQQDVNVTTFNNCRHISDFDRNLLDNVIIEGKNFIFDFDMLFKWVIFANQKQKKSPMMRRTSRGRFLMVKIITSPKTVKVMTKMSFQTHDAFADAHNRFAASTESQRLQEKFEVKPYWERNRLLRNVAALSSYGLNLFSAATAFTCVYVFLNTLFKNDVLAGSFALAFLLIIETFKRLTIPQIFKNFFQFKKVNFWRLGFMVCLVAISVLLSYLGAKDTVKMFTPSVQLTDVNGVKQPFNDRIKALESRLSEIRETQSWRGKLTPQGQKSYNQVTNQIAEVESEMLQNSRKTVAKNDETTRQHTNKTSVNAHYFGLFTLVLDLSLIGFLFYCEYYDYRSFTEFAQLTTKAPPQYATEKQSSKPTSNEGNDVATPEVFQDVATSSNGIDEGVLKLAIKNARANLAAYEAKLRNNDGNEDTNLRGIDRWKQKLSELEGLSSPPVSMA
jgi:hypothetical protein